MLSANARTALTRIAGPALAALLAAALMAAPALAAKKPPPADLVVTSISTSGTGKPAHVVLHTDGSTGGFIVFVNVHNNGPGFAPRSKVAVTAHFEKESQVIGVERVPSLRRGSGDEVEIPIEHKFNNLGFAWLSAEANASGVVPETKAARANNRHYAPKARIAFLAKVWKVGVFAAVDLAPESMQGGWTGKSETENTPTMKFRFREYSHADEAFIYDVEGGVAGYAKGEDSQKICTMGGSGAASHYPWDQPYNLLRISQTLKTYHAYVFASDEKPFSTPMFCNGMEIPGDVSDFLDLVTYEAGSFIRPMKPSAPLLEGAGHDQTTLVKWQFWAEIPDRPQPPPPPEYPSE